MLLGYLALICTSQERFVDPGPANLRDLALRGGRSAHGVGPIEVQAIDHECPIWEASNRYETSQPAFRRARRVSRRRRSSFETCGGRGRDRAHITVCYRKVACSERGAAEIIRRLECRVCEQLCIRPH